MQTAHLAYCLLFVSIVIGCDPPEQPGAATLPFAFISKEGEPVRYGQPVPGWTAGTSVVAFVDLHLPDGAVEVYAEADDDGLAYGFEYLYPPEHPFAAVRGYYEGLLGPSTHYYERVAGYCYAWEYPASRFEVCGAREPSDNGYGTAIAHLRYH